MDAPHLQELIDLEEGYWWHVAKRRLAVEILQRYLPAPGLLVEGGLGSGRNLREFQRLGYEVAGLDIMPESVARARQVGLPDAYLHDLTEPWPIAPGTVRAVVMLDVLEHVPDPIRTLSHVVATLRDDGGVVITVPAYPRLYSQWDRKLGHYLRYTSSELLRQTAAAGLQPLYEGHWNSFSVPAALVSRKLRRSGSDDDGAVFPRVPRLLNQMLIGCAWVERFVLRRVRVPIGLSLVGVFVKQGNASRACNEPASP
ncbi:MAG: class I SAM-dependent methyltransferase [Pirellulaceae bacterium]|nr:class I SAM-dependent methyltransferase [Pirellulaceae bacterium]MCU0977919.1 class I SAM-dependent methyltransferase [Pirellulaceae bacterium]